MKTFLLIAVASMAVTHFAQAQYTFGPQVQRFPPNGNITYDSGTGLIQYTGSSDTRDVIAYIPLTGGAASLITASTDWTASLTVNLAARTLTLPQGNPNNLTPDAAMGLTISINNSSSDGIGMQLSQINNTGQGVSSDTLGNYYGSLAIFAARKNGGTVNTTTLGSSVAISTGASDLLLNGGTSSSPASESISAVSGVLAFSYNHTTNILTGYYNGNPVGSCSLANWAPISQLTLYVMGFSEEGADVPAGSDMGSNFYVDPFNGFALGSGWQSSSWFGVFNANYYPWIYHNEHGFMYVFGTDPNSIWLWTTDMGFLWTSSTVYPFLWSNSGQAWLYYIKGSHNPRSFYNYKTNKWESRNP